MVLPPIKYPYSNKRMKFHLVIYVYTNKIQSHHFQRPEKKNIPNSLCCFFIKNVSDAKNNP